MPSSKLLQTILNCGMHVIVTLRTKQDYIIHDKSGRKRRIKPIQKDGIDYEFTVAFEDRPLELKPVRTEQVCL